MRKITSILAVGSAAYFASVLMLTMTGTASASDRRVNASACHAYYDNNGTGVFAGASFQNSTGGWIAATCPIPSDSWFPHTAITTVNVHGYAPGTTSQSKACVKSYSTASATCGNTMWWPTGYTGAIGLDTSALAADPYGFPYLYHYIMNGTSIYGFYLAG